MGKRLWPLTKNIPKSLINIEGRTVLEYIILNLNKNGIKDFIIVVGHQKEEVQKTCDAIREEFGVNFDLVENERYFETNTGYSVKIALENVDDDVIIINGDNVFDIGIIENLLRCKNSAIIIDNVKKLNDESFKIALDSENKIIEMMGKEIDIDSSNGEFIGISALKHEDIPFYRGILDQLLNKNEMEYYDIAYIDFSIIRNLDFVFTKGLKWTEIDDFEDLKNAEKLVRELWNEGYDNY